MIAHLVLLLTDNPDQLALLKSDPSLLRNTVEEGLRRRGSSTGAFRVATEDTELGGQKLPRGSLVCLLLPGGSLDSEIFPDPGRFDINRPNANKHLALGFGLHACIGQPLVRMETPIAIRELYRRMPDLHIDRAMPMAYTPTFGFSGLNQITARWTPG
jgi:cytochrome P450